MELLSEIEKKTLKPTCSFRIILIELLNFEQKDFLIGFVRMRIGIPALAAIVEDVFVARSALAAADSSELDTQKEVLVAMLLRLVDHHEVLSFSAVLCDFI
jgi:hypothetical protein